MKIAAWVIGLLLAGLLSVADAAQPVAVTASDGSANDAFGAAMAATDTHVAIGAPGATIDGRSEQGAVYIFERADCTLRETAKLVATDGAAGEQFGTSLAMREDVLLIGATGASGAQPGHGAVYVFTRQRDEWVQTDKLFAPNGAVNSGFGTSVASDGRTIMVGAPQAGAGEVHAFEQQRGDWQHVQELQAEDPAFFAEFGSSLAVDGEMALIGAPATSSSSGSFYYFERERGDDGWEQEEQWRPAFGLFGARVGASMSGTEDHVAIGAPGAETRDTFMSGVVYLYERDDDEIEEEIALTASDWRADDRFGSALALNRDRLAVAAINAGRVYVFERDADWQESAGLEAPREGEQFGASVALTADLVIAAAPGATMEGNTRQGAVYVFQLED